MPVVRQMRIEHDQHHIDKNKIEDDVDYWWRRRAQNIFGEASSLRSVDVHIVELQWPPVNDY